MYLQIFFQAWKRFFQLPRLGAADRLIFDHATRAKPATG
jgi:hypothetical protein